jgi:hypothetical protein
MSPQKQSAKPILFIRDLCKDKTEAEILEAEENFRRYLLVVKRICERLEDEENSLDKPSGY